MPGSKQQRRAAVERVLLRIADAYALPIVLSPEILNAFGGVPASWIGGHRWLARRLAPHHLRLAFVNGAPILTTANA